MHRGCKGERMRLLTVVTIATLFILFGCKKEEVEETDSVETGSTETGAVETDAPVDTDPAQ